MKLQLHLRLIASVDHTNCKLLPHICIIVHIDLGPLFVLSAVITIHDPISVHLVHIRALNPIAIMTDVLMSAHLVIPY